MIGRRLRVAGALGLLTTVIAAAAPAGAHAVLVKSTPASRATMSQPPSRVALWFNERLEPSFSSVSVWSASSVQVDRRDPAVSAEDPKRLTVTLGPLPPGSYTVRFRVLSVDGHVVESSFPFTVRSPR